jgi:hypothetical protein
MADEVASLILGPVKVYYAPVGETLPDENAVGYGVAWGGNWTAFGYTKAALSCNYSFDEVEAMVQEALAAVKRRKTKEALVLETVLSELTADNIQLGSGGTVTDTAAGAAQVQKEELEAGNNAVLNERAWGFEGEYRKDDGTQFPIRLFIFKGTANLNGALEFSKESDGTGIPIQVKALHDASQTAGKNLFMLQKVLAPHT